MVRHMESDDFMQMVNLCVCVLRNIRGMLENPPELNEAVSHMTSNDIIQFSKGSLCIKISSRDKFFYTVILLVTCLLLLLGQHSEREDTVHLLHESRDAAKEKVLTPSGGREKGKNLSTR